MSLIRPALIALCAAPLAAAAAPPAVPDAFLATLAGEWELVGTLGGKPARYHGEGRWVLHGGWLRLNLTDVHVPPCYGAGVHLGYDAAAGDYIAHWLDRSGAAAAREVPGPQRE